MCVGGGVGGRGDLVQDARSQGRRTGPVCGGGGAGRSRSEIYQFPRTSDESGSPTRCDPSGSPSQRVQGTHTLPQPDAAPPPPSPRSLPTLKLSLRISTACPDKAS